MQRGDCFVAQPRLAYEASRLQEPYACETALVHSPPSFPSFSCPLQRKPSPALERHRRRAGRQRPRQPILRRATQLRLLYIQHPRQPIRRQLARHLLLHLLQPRLRSQHQPLPRLRHPLLLLPLPRLLPLIIGRPRPLRQRRLRLSSQRPPMSRPPLPGSPRPSRRPLLTWRLPRPMSAYAASCPS